MVRNVKATIVQAKDVFDAINNQVGVRPARDAAVQTQCAVEASRTSPHRVQGEKGAETVSANERLVPPLTWKLYVHPPASG